MGDAAHRGQLSALHSTLRAQGVSALRHAQTDVLATSLGIKCDGPGTAWESDAGSDARPFTAREALSILTHMTDADVALLGLDPKRRTQHMVLTTLVVPPPCTRPAIYSSEGSRSRGQNDLTVKFLEILKRSHELRNAVQGAHWRDVVVTEDVTERLARLQYEVFTLVNNNVRGHVATGRGVSTGKSLTDHSRARRASAQQPHGQARRLSARCVITPDAYFDCNRVGVPDVAKGLTVPDSQRPTSRALAPGAPGADHVRSADSVIHLDTVTPQALRRPRRRGAGRPVRRALPRTATSWSSTAAVAAHARHAVQVRLMPGHTFRLSLPVATPYNADDGVG